MTFQQLSTIQNKLHNVIDLHNASINQRDGTNYASVKDGILDLETYSQLSALCNHQGLPAPLKIAFVLKEAPVGNAILYEDVWNPDDFVQANQAIHNVCTYKTLWYMAFVAHQLIGKVLPPLTARRNYPQHLINHPEIQAFCSTAHFNIRKQRGNSSTSWNDLVRYAQDWGSIVMQQIIDYDSDIVFWCGTFNACRAVNLFSNVSLDEKVSDYSMAIRKTFSTSTDPGNNIACYLFTAIVNNKKRLFISCYHPGYFRIPGGCNAYWSAIVQAVKDFVKRELGYII